jgi:DNA-binding transcriptional regulator YhcF (GntR family)
MAHDRVEGDDLVVTHSEIAVMLGIRRASVTDALHVLEGDRLIRANRGHITILDRDALRSRAGTTYGFAEEEYSRLIAPFPERA